MAQTLDLHPTGQVTPSRSLPSSAPLSHWVGWTARQHPMKRGWHEPRSWKLNQNIRMNERWVVGGLFGSWLHFISLKSSIESISSCAHLLTSLRDFVELQNHKNMEIRPMTFHFKHLQTHHSVGIARHWEVRRYWIKPCNQCALDRFLTEDWSNNHLHSALYLPLLNKQAAWERSTSVYQNHFCPSTGRDYTFCIFF